MVSIAMSNLDLLREPPARPTTPGLLNGIRSFLSGDRVWELLEEQAAALHRGGEPSEAEVERISRGITAELRRVVVPIDREDLQELSSVIERVAAHRRRAQHALTTLDAERREQTTRPLEELLVSCTLTVDKAVRRMGRREYASVLDLARELRKLQREAEVAHDEALSSLLGDDNPNGAHLLVSTKGPLDDLAATIRECGTLGKFLAFLAVKNG